MLFIHIEQQSHEAAPLCYFPPREEKAAASEFGFQSGKQLNNITTTRVKVTHRTVWNLSPAFYPSSQGALSSSSTTLFDHWWLGQGLIPESLSPRGDTLQSFTSQVSIHIFFLFLFFLWSTTFCENVQKVWIYARFHWLMFWDHWDRLTGDIYMPHLDWESLRITQDLLEDFSGRCFCWLTLIAKALNQHFWFHYIFRQLCNFDLGIAQKSNLSLKSF